MKPVKGSSRRDSIQYVDKTESLIRITSVITFLVVFSFSWLLILVVMRDFFFVFPVEAARMSMLSQFILYLIYGSIPIFAIICFILGPWLLMRKQVVVPLIKAYPEVNETVNECSKDIGLKKTPEAYLIQSYDADCFVFGRSANNAKLLISKPLLDSLTRDELRSVILHELAHAKNGDMVFMTWGVYFQQSLKYWVALYTIAFFACPILLEGIPISRFSAYTIFRMIFIGSVLETPVIFLLVIFIFVTATVNSVSRVRELLSDTYASGFVDGLQLISAIKKAYLWQLTASALNRGSQRFREKLTGFFFSKMPQFLIKHYASHHPSLKDRIASIKDRNLILSSNRIHVPSLETYVYVGIVASLVLIGAKELLFNLAFARIFDVFDFGVYGFYVMITPSLLLIMLLNGVFVLRSDPRTYTDEQGDKLLIKDGFLKATTIRIAASSISFFILSFFMFFPLDNFFLLTINPPVVTERLISAIKDGALISFLSFLCAILFFLILVIYKTYPLYQKLRADNR